MQSERSHLNRVFLNYKWWPKKKKRERERERTANVSDVQNPKKHESSPFNAHKSHQMHDFVCVANSHTMFKLDWV